jgi:pimeloyl-ACP methyl ester carboxylesterase
MTMAVAEHNTEVRYRIDEAYLDGAHGRIRYWASQPQHGLPVLLVHGYGALIDHWRAVARPIARKHTLYAIDLYGFGYSARPSGAPSKERWADQVAEFVRRVIGRPAVIVGHSMGGVVVSEFARRYPELVHGLVLVNSSGAQMMERPVTSTDRLMMNLIGTPLVGEALANVFASPSGVRRGLLQSYHVKERVTPELVRTFSGPLQKYGPQSYLAVSRRFQNLTLDMQAGEITAPSLLIWGEYDESIPPSQGKLIQERILPQAELKVLKDSGHCPFDETPEAFVDALLPWIDGLPQ